MLRTAIAAMLVSGVAGAAAPARAQGDTAEQAALLWQRLRMAEPDSPEFEAARQKMEALAKSLTGARRTAAAAAMMDAGAEDSVNTAAVELFGPDSLSATDVQRILWDEQRTWGQRELLKAYYGLCRQDAKSSALSEEVCWQLVTLLADRLENLVGQKVGYGEQRLLAHLCMSVLPRCAGGAGAPKPQAAKLFAAMERYAEKAGGGDPLGAAMAVWLDLRSAAPGPIDTLGRALQAMGHWDAVSRLKAATFLAEEIGRDEKAGRIVLAALDDPREEAQAAAARALGFARSYRPDVVVPKLVEMLTKGRGVVAQAAAADALIARADQARGQVAALLAALSDPGRIAGALRTGSILLVLSHLAPYATAAQRGQILTQALRNLRRSGGGALAALGALGEEARPAVPSIREYRATADRFCRLYIDRHVLPAIQPELPRK